MGATTRSKYSPTQASLRVEVEDDSDSKEVDEKEEEDQPKQKRTRRRPGSSTKFLSRSAASMA